MPKMKKQNFVIYVSCINGAKVAVQVQTMKGELQTIIHSLVSQKINILTLRSNYKHSKQNRQTTCVNF